MKKKCKPVHFESRLGDKCTRNRFVYKTFSTTHRRLKKAKLPCAMFASFEKVVRAYSTTLTTSSPFCHWMMPISFCHFSYFQRKHLIGF